MNLHNECGYTSIKVEKMKNANTKMREIQLSQKDKRAKSKKNETIEEVENKKSEHKKVNTKNMGKKVVNLTIFF